MLLLDANDGNPLDETKKRQKVEAKDVDSDMSDDDVSDDTDGNSPH